MAENQATAGRQRKPSVSLQMYALRNWSGDGLTRLRRLAQIGFNGVELAGYEGFTAAELRKVLDDLGLVTTASFIAPPTADNVGQIIEHAHTLDCKFGIVTMGPDPWKTAEGVRQTAESLQRGAELLAAEGVQLLYHNHNWEFDALDGELPYETFFRLAPATMSLLDVYYACNFGKLDAAATVRKWAGRIPMIHVKDGPLTPGAIQQPLGDGRMDVLRCIRAADPQTLQWVAVDLETCHGDMMDAIERSYRYLIDSGLVEGNR